MFYQGARNPFLLLNHIHNNRVASTCNLKSTINIEKQRSRMYRPACWQIPALTLCTAHLIEAFCEVPPWWWSASPDLLSPPLGGWTLCWSSKCSRLSSVTPVPPGPTWWSGCCSTPPPQRCCRWLATCAPPRSSGTDRGSSSCPRCPDPPGRFYVLEKKTRLDSKQNSLDLGILTFILTLTTTLPRFCK